MKLNEEINVKYSCELPFAGEYDVVVCGGGPAGCAAALSARRAGLTVLLVESQGQLGGMGTSGLVSHWLGGRTADGKWVVGGIFRELSTEAANEGFALLPVIDNDKKYQPHGWYNGLVHGVPFDPFAMAAFLDSKMNIEGVDILFNTQAVETIVDNERISHVIISNKNGLQAISVKAVIDATGDADMAARSGCNVKIGRDDDNLMTPATLMFHVDNVDQDAVSEYIYTNDQPRFIQLINELREKGEWTFPYEIFICVQMQEKGVMMINTSRLCDVNGIDQASLTRGFQRGREETQKLLNIMRKRFPGFENVRLKAVAPLIGIRETRRIAGDYMLSVDDLLNGNDFDDTIGYSCYGWDLPDPKRPSHQPMHGIKKAPYTPIPYKIMLPTPIQNLICPGRAVSVERDVLGPLRVMAPVMAMGEAAGVAAIQVVSEYKSFADIDFETLRNTLHENGAIISVVDIA
jgi:hypothetical protein